MGRNRYAAFSQLLSGAMNEVEDQRSAEAGIPTAPQRRRGRRPTRPWERLEVTVTLQLIHNTWHTLALGLAQEDAVPEAAFIRMMTRAKVPPEL